MKQLTIFLFAFIFIVRTTSGHVGGHYHSGDGTVFNSWTLKNGQHVLGNFMYSNGRQIFVEANEGKLLPFKWMISCLQTKSWLPLKYRNWKK